jgi:hypothetical protein
LSTCSTIRDGVDATIAHDFKPVEGEELVQIGHSFVDQDGTVLTGLLIEHSLVHVVARVERRHNDLLEIRGVIPIPDALLRECPS